MAVMFVLIPIYLNEIGMPLSYITLIIGIAAIPVTLKFIWGGITDILIPFLHLKCLSCCIFIL